jgi:hypothetical protein
VAFADVNHATAGLAKATLDVQQPGEGGWPTIRYFNKETGPAGASYLRKLGGMVCDELKQDKYMTAYIEEAGKTKLAAPGKADGKGEGKAAGKGADKVKGKTAPAECDVFTAAGCGEKETSYLEKLKGLDQKQLKDQLRRLAAMDTANMKPDIKGWLETRVGILTKLTAAKEEL